MSCNEYRFDVNIDLENTLFCGQTFFWRREGEGYLACIGGRPVYISASENELIVRSSGERQFWSDYFDIERDYSKIAKRHTKDAHICAAYSCFSGIRVLRQPVWETLCSFIISANNNIKRITGIIERLSKSLGEPRSYMGHTLYSFPAPDAIVGAGVDVLRQLGLGYRAPYLFETAGRIANGYDLSALSSMGYKNALKELTTFKGVGEKVADCVLLFSCGYTDAFPVDVWVKRVMKSLYHVEGSPSKVKEAAANLFGADAGIAQQMLFHGARMDIFSELM